MKASQLTAQRYAKGKDLVSGWRDKHAELKARDPEHRVLVDVAMERVYSPHPAEIIRQTHGPEALHSLEAMREVDLSRVWQQMQLNLNEPPGGSGGLGICVESIAWSGARFGKALNFGLFTLSPFYDKRRVQVFDGFWQKPAFLPTPAENSALYTPLAALEISFNHKPTEIEALLFTGFKNKDNFVPAACLKMPGGTGGTYENNRSQENFNQVYVLGAAGMRLCQEFGILGVDAPLADTVVGHDSHAAVFAFELFLYFYGKFKDVSAAKEATKEFYRQNVHATQGGTIARTTGDKVRTHYPPEIEALYGDFGLEPFQETNALWVGINLSGKVGVVSPMHKMTVTAERKATERGFSGTARDFLPKTLPPEELEIFHDTIDPESWLGAGVMQALDTFRPGWREDLNSLGDDAVIDALRANQEFRRSLAEAYAVQEEHFLGLYNNHFPRKFGIDIPEKAIVFAALRRMVPYKVDLISHLLHRLDIIDRMAEKLGRPFYFLFGGFAHNADHNAIEALKRLLQLIEKINKENHFLKADLLVGHDYDKAKWIFPGLARRGCWLGCTDPLFIRSEGCEALGPSYFKGGMNGLYLIGPDDGGASRLRALPMVRVFGPTTNVAGLSLHNDLWSNEMYVRGSRTLLENGFLRVLEETAGSIATDLTRFESGRGYLAPGLDARIITTNKIIAQFNGSLVIKSYLD